MSDVQGADAAIMEFVELAATARMRALPVEDRARMQALEETLRGTIHGAKLAPRRVEGRQATQDLTSDLAAPTKGAAAPPSSVKGLSGISSLADQMEMSTKDKSKVREMRVEDLPPSSYTPSRSPRFLADYYAEG